MMNRAMHSHDTQLADIRTELERLDAQSVRAEIDRKFEPETGRLLAVGYGGAHWHMFPQDFLNLLGELPDGVGAEAVKEAIERDVTHLWHGPEPEGSRDT